MIINSKNNSIFHKGLTKVKCQIPKLRNIHRANGCKRLKNISK